MTTAMDALMDARAAWERSQPQLFLELDPLDETPALGGADGKPAAGVSSSGPLLLATTPPPGGPLEQPTTAARPQNLGRDLRGRAAEGV